MALSPRAKKTALPLLALTVGVIFALGQRFLAPENKALVMTFSGLVIVGALVVSVLCWRALDEVARDAHKTAWYWGGSIGMLVAFIAFLALKKLAPDLLIGAGRAPLELIEFGFIGVILAQLAGYLVVWAGWWFVRR